jgi:hypothetical protein
MWAKESHYLPTVLTPEAVKAIIQQMTGIPSPPVGAFSIPAQGFGSRNFD